MDKRCSVCEASKAVAEFAPDRRAADGLACRCRPCHRAACKLSRERHIEKERARGRANYHANRERYLAHASEYAKAHPEKGRARSRRYREAHPEAVSERGKRWWQKRGREWASGWRAENRDKRIGYYQKWRAAKLGGGSDLTHEQWEAILASYGNECAYCGQSGRLSQDHVVPLSRGGEHTLTNVVPACSGCNSRKSDRTALEWFAGLTRMRVRVAV